MGIENQPNWNNWLEAMQLDHPLLIAGPCSAETEDQVMEIAHDLKNSDVNFFRSGIWKPRTRPGSFEGVGEIGLKWLQNVTKETGLKTAVEVANARHVELALEHDIDLLWIGARSTVSPFIVQEIANALAGTEKIVLVKNPINPDFGLWVGAIERLYHANIKNIGAIHRGFSTSQKSKYRNIPEWGIPIDLQTRFPDLPLLCDPSHITGQRDMIFEIAQIALDLNYNGLMIETHCNPDKAWSDAEQQVTPKRLLEIIDNLNVREESAQDQEFEKEIAKFRARIDIIDQHIVNQLGDRMRISHLIGQLKKKHNVAIFQPKRWKYILDRMITNANEQELSEDFILSIFKAIHEESIRQQSKNI